MICYWKSLQPRLYFVRVCTHQISSVRYRTSSVMYDLFDQLSTVAKESNTNIDKFTEIVQKLQTATGNDCFASPQGQRHVALIAYDLKKLKKYKELDLLISEMKSVGCNVPDGIQSTLFMSYVDRRLWEDATSLLKSGSRTSSIKHLRWYNYLIDGFAKDEKLDEAHFYFKELIDVEKSAMFKRNVKAKQNTITSLLQTFVDTKQSIAKKSDGDSLIKSILHYMQLNNLVATEQNIVLLSKAFAKENYTVAISDLEEGHCSCCSKHVTPQQCFQQIGSLVSSSIRSQLVSSGRYTTLQHVDEYFQNGNTYSFVIDLANVLHYGSRRQTKELTSHSFKRIENILKNITNLDSSAFQRVILVMPQSGIEKLGNLTKTIHKVLQESYLNVHIDTITTRKIEDDLLFLYIFSKSEALLPKSSKSPVYVISNDTFVKYSYTLVPSEYQMEMLLWLRHKIKGFDFKGMVDFAPHVSNVSYIGDNDIHVKCEDGKIMCIHKK